MDGLRLDVDGRIFVTHNGKGLVAVVAADGTLVREVATLEANPSNLTFGGPDGRTVYLTQVQGGFIETFRSDRPAVSSVWPKWTPAVGEDEHLANPSSL